MCCISAVYLYNLVRFTHTHNQLAEPGYAKKKQHALHGPPGHVDPKEVFFLLAGVLIISFYLYVSSNRLVVFLH